MAFWIMVALAVFAAFARAWKARGLRPFPWKACGLRCAHRRRSGASAPSPPAHTLSTGPQGAPTLRACPQAFHTLGRWLETAARSPQGPLRN